MGLNIGGECMFDEFEAMSPQTLFVSATPGPYEDEHADDQLYLQEIDLRASDLLFGNNLSPRVFIRIYPQDMLMRFE